MLSDIFSLTALPCLGPLGIPPALGGALPRGTAGDQDRSVWLDALCLELPPDLGPPGHLLALRGIGVGACEVVGVDFGQGVGLAEGLGLDIRSGPARLRGRDLPAADEPVRSRVEGADVEDLWALEVLGWEHAADEPARSCVKGVDVEDLRALEVL